MFADAQWAIRCCIKIVLGGGFYLQFRIKHNWQIKQVAANKPLKLPRKTTTDIKQQNQYQMKNQKSLIKCPHHTTAYVQ